MRRRVNQLPPHDRSADPDTMTVHRMIRERDPDPNIPNTLRPIGALIVVLYTNDDGTESTIRRAGTGAAHHFAQLGMIEHLRHGITT